MEVSPEEEQFVSGVSRLRRRGLAEVQGPLCALRSSVRVYSL